MARQARRQRRSPALTGAAVIVVAILAALGLHSFLKAGGPAAVEDGVSLYFSPEGGCTEAVVRQINQAVKSIRVQAYSFTSKPIAEALVNARRRGLEVVVLLDKDNRTDQYSAATFLKNQQIPVFIDARHAIAHNKIMLIDDRAIITGSFNFTRQAEERNAENLLVIEGKPILFAAYLRNFEEHRAHSEAY